VLIKNNLNVLLINLYFVCQLPRCGAADGVEVSSTGGCPRRSGKILPIKKYTTDVCAALSKI